MMNIDDIKYEILTRIADLNPEKVILFGSYSDGTANENSDLDIYIVDKEKGIPKNYREKSELYLKYASALRDLRGQISIDIIAHTLAMHEKFFQMNSSFAREIMTSGVIIYES